MRRFIIFLFIIMTLISISFAEVATNINQSIDISTETVERSNNDILNQIQASTVLDPQSYGYKDFKWGMSVQELQSIFPINISPVQGTDLDKYASRSGLIREPGESDRSLRTRWIRATGEELSPEQIRMGTLSMLANAINGATAFLFPQYIERLSIGANGESLTSGPLAFEASEGVMGMSLGKTCYYDFYFADNKLIGVEIGFSPAYKGKTSFRKILSEMIAKYGKATPPAILIYKKQLSNPYTKDEKVLYTAWISKGKVIVLEKQTIGGIFSDNTFEVFYVDINWYYEHLKPFLAESVGNKLKNDSRDKIEKNPIE